MSYRVIWRERLRQSFVSFAFLDHEMGRGYDAVPTAVAEIERRLAADPASEGESRSDNERVLIVFPLTVVYEVFEEQQVVLIYAAIHYPRGRG